VSNRKLPRKGKKSGGLYKPWLLVVAAALFWAGLNQPASLTPVTVVLWGLSAVTAGVLMRAVLAVAEPLAKLVFEMLKRASDEAGAEEP
jgi:hypothetical protein